MEKNCAQIFGTKLHHRGSKWANALPASPASFPPVISQKRFSLSSEEITQSILKSCNIHEYIFVCIAAAGRGCDIPLAPPVMQLRSKNLSAVFLHFASPPTPEQPDFAQANPIFPVPEGRKIRLFCGQFKVLVPPPNNPFEPPTVAKGLTH